MSKVKKVFGEIEPYVLKQDYFWSHLKAEKIVINGLTASQTSSSSGGQRFALVGSK